MCAVHPGCWALLTAAPCVGLQVDPHLTRFIAELKLRDASAGEPMEVAAPEAEQPPLAHMPSEPTPPATEVDAKVHPLPARWLARFGWREIPVQWVWLRCSTLSVCASSYALAPAKPPLVTILPSPLCAGAGGGAATGAAQRPGAAAGSDAGRAAQRAALAHALAPRQPARWAPALPGGSSPRACFC